MRVEAGAASRIHQMVIHKDAQGNCYILFNVSPVLIFIISLCLRMQSTRLLLRATLQTAYPRSEIDSNGSMKEVVLLSILINQLLCHFKLRNISSNYSIHFQLPLLTFTCITSKLLYCLTHLLQQHVSL